MAHCQPCIPTGTWTDVTCSVRMNPPSVASARGVAASATSGRGSLRASGERRARRAPAVACLQCSRAPVTTSVKSACTAPNAARLGGYSALSVSLARVLACAAREGAPPAPPGVAARRPRRAVRLLPQWRAQTSDSD
jgi:hypothetical protein